MDAEPRSSLRAAARRLGSVVLALACVAPVLTLLAFSVAGSWRPPGLLPDGVSLDRWLDVLGRRGELLGSLGLSVALSLAVAAASTACGFLASRQVSRSRHRGLLIVFAYAPFAVSPVVLAACLLFFFIQIGLSGTAAGVFLAQLILGIGFSVVFFLGVWSPRMLHMEQLVRTLGGTARDAILRALVPASRGMIVICFFQVFLLSWVQYGLTLVVGQGKVKTLPIKVYDFVFEANPFDAAVVGAVLVLPPLLLLWLNRRVLFKTV